MISEVIQGFVHENIVFFNLFILVATIKRDVTLMIPLGLTGFMGCI